MTFWSFNIVRKVDICYPMDKSKEGLRFTFTPNGRREFVPHDQVFPLFSVYSLLLLNTKNMRFYTSFNNIGIARDCFYLFSILRCSQLECDVCRLW